MTLQSVNPMNGKMLEKFSTWDESVLSRVLDQVACATLAWRETSLAGRCALMRTLAEILSTKQDALAVLISNEMGKLYSESTAEVTKCAWACRYYAEQGPAFLADEIIESDAGRSYVAYQPLGTVLAVMPWNFPLWQVFRFAVPALLAGNTVVLKHASNVTQCALAIEELFSLAGFPENVFRALLITAEQVAQVVDDARVHAVTLTGSEQAGRQVAATAGASLKKTVLELGGSDAFIVLDDADLNEAVKNAVVSRFLNAGQSCIAAKRFIVTERIADEFVDRFKCAIEVLVMGDPLANGITLAPMARDDLRHNLHQQVSDSIARGAVAMTGCAPREGEGYYYHPSMLDNVMPGMPAFDEELFGPVAAIIRVRDAENALQIANQSRYGLGGSIWTGDVESGEALARRMDAGAVFVNGMVKSDPRLPFGGIKASGYGRELSHHGIHEFINHKTVWIKR